MICFVYVFLKIPYILQAIIFAIFFKKINRYVIIVRNPYKKYIYRNDMFCVRF